VRNRNALRVTFNSGARVERKSHRSQDSPSNTAVKTRACDFVRKESFRVEKRSDDRCIVPCREIPRRPDAVIIAERKRPHSTIDKRRCGSLSSEKIFVAVCERSLTHATEARTASHTLRRNGRAIDVESTRDPFL
jgi:hypothetical protein